MNNSHSRSRLSHKVSAMLVVVMATLVTVVSLVEPAGAARRNDRDFNVTFKKVVCPEESGKKQVQFRFYLWDRTRSGSILDYYWLETRYGPGGVGSFTSSGRQGTLKTFWVKPENDLELVEFYEGSYDNVTYRFTDLEHNCGKAAA